MYYVFIKGEPALPFDRLRDARIYAQGAAYEGKRATVRFYDRILAVYGPAYALPPI